LAIGEEKSSPFVISDIINVRIGVKMSFTSMKVSDLREVGEYFAVDLEGLKTKNEILSVLTEEGITYEMYSKFLGAEKATVDLEPKKAKKTIVGETVLVRMERANPTYQVNGYVFTKEHPYVAMSVDDAEYLFSNEKGFRMATPREVQEYYN
jgi:hypothetical protein